MYLLTSPMVNYYSSPSSFPVWQPSGGNGLRNIINMHLVLGMYPTT